MRDYLLPAVERFQQWRSDVDHVDTSSRFRVLIRVERGTLMMTKPVMMAVCYRVYVQV
jgi:hypothetical protein